MVESQLREAATVISWLLGWSYFLAWSISFYPQAILNLRRRTTQGLRPDFPLMNILGFSCYTTSNAVFLYSSVIRQQYAARHPLSPEPTVRVNDLVFAAHALTFCFITYSQFWPRLWGWKVDGNAIRSVNKFSLGLVWGGLLGIAIVVLIVAGRSDGGASSTAWAWIDVIYATSYVKLLMTCFKYIPQVVANFRRKSTLGWSIAQQLLDLTGSILSLSQLVLDSALQADWSGLTGNPAKLGISNISLLFNFIFIFQHYVLYGPVEETCEEQAVGSGHGQGSERQPLLS